METVNGELTLSIPSNLGVQVHMDTSHGALYSDFEVDVLPRAPTIIRNSDGSGSEIRVESVIIANVNAGVPIVRMNTLNGDLQIRQAQ